MKFDIFNEHGIKVSCKMLFCFKNNNISYIVYTNGHRTGGKLDIYASRYMIANGSYVLSNIENDYEWDAVDFHLANYLKES